MPMIKNAGAALLMSFMAALLLAACGGGGGGAGVTATSAVHNQWTWMSGSNSTVGDSGVYGAKGVAAPANFPGGRQGALSWTDKSGNRWLFGGTGYSSIAGNGALNDLWKFDGTNWTWVSGSNTFFASGMYGVQGVAAPGNVPGARGGSANWTDKTGNLWLFGGIGYDSVGTNYYLNDLWKFDGTNWTWVSGSNLASASGVYGTQGVAAPANVPGSRELSAGWTDKSGNLWLFGGGTVGGGARGEFNDLWKFDGTNWTWVSGSSTTNASGVYGTQGVAAPANVPGARHSAASWTDGSGNLWLFGGLGYDSAGTGGDLNDLWKFDGTNWTWVSGSKTGKASGVYGTRGVAAPANVPGARAVIASWIDGSGNLWLFGESGYDSAGTAGSLNDLWKFDGTNWTWMSGSNTVGASGVYGTQGVAAAANVPGVRGGSATWIDASGSLLLFGGAGTSFAGFGYFNDLWRYQP